MGAIVAKSPKKLSVDRECGNTGKLQDIGVCSVRSFGRQIYLSGFQRKAQYSEQLVDDRQTNSILDFLLQANTSDEQESCLRSIAKVISCYLACNCHIHFIY